MEQIYADSNGEATCFAGCSWVWFDHFTYSIFRTRIKPCPYSRMDLPHIFSCRICRTSMCCGKVFSFSSYNERERAWQF